jgi:hypothetical protein
LGRKLLVRQQYDGVAKIGQVCRLVNDAGGGDLENICAAWHQRDILRVVHGVDCSSGDCLQGRLAGANRGWKLLLQLEYLL